MSIVVAPLSLVSTSGPLPETLRWRHALQRSASGSGRSPTSVSWFLVVISLWWWFAWWRRAAFLVTLSQTHGFAAPTAQLGPCRHVRLCPSPPAAPRTTLASIRNCVSESVPAVQEPQSPCPVGVVHRLHDTERRFFCQHHQDQAQLTWYLALIRCPVRHRHRSLRQVFHCRHMARNMKNHSCHRASSPRKAGGFPSFVSKMFCAVATAGASLAECSKTCSKKVIKNKKNQKKKSKKVIPKSQKSNKKNIFCNKFMVLIIFYKNNYRKVIPKKYIPKTCQKEDIKRMISKGNFCERVVYRHGAMLLILRVRSGFSTRWFRPHGRWWPRHRSWKVKDKM